MTRPASPHVDVVIPVHAADRPIRRAVKSVFLGSAAAAIRVTVVCHRLPTAQVAERLSGLDGVRLLHCDDTTRSAAAPMNAGLAVATAPFVSRLDSDDTFEPGAVDAWLAHARRTRADVVIAPLRPAGGDVVYAPLTRPARHRRLDPVRDRLSYRTAPFGLIRREYLQRSGAAYTQGMQVGEDLEFGLRLWFGGGRIDLAASAPAYVVHDDAVQRTTHEERPVSLELAAADRVLTLPWFLALADARRQSIVHKIARIHVLDAVRNRMPRGLSAADVVDLQTTLAAFDRVAPGWRVPFNRRDSAVFDALAAGQGIRAQDLMRAPAGRADTLLAHTLRGTLHRESTLRRYARYALPR